MGSKILYSGLTCILAAGVLLPTYTSSFAVIGALAMVIGTVMIWINK